MGPSLLIAVAVGILSRSPVTSLVMRMTCSTGFPSPSGCPWKIMRSATGLRYRTVWSVSVVTTASPMEASVTSRRFSARFRSLISRAMDETPTIAPFASRIGHMSTATSTSEPSLRRRTVSWCSTTTPRFTRSQTAISSATRSGGSTIANGWPLASAAV
jgi:hypothetical protein